MRYLALTLLSSFMLSSMARAQADDVVQVLTETSRPPTIGRIGWESGATCIGTLIGSDLVLTSASCVNTDLGWEDIATAQPSFRFFPVVGGTERRVSVVSGRPHPVFHSQTAAWARRADHNVAVFRLERPIPGHLAVPARLAHGMAGRGEVALLDPADMQNERAEVAARCTRRAIRNIEVGFQCPLGLDTSRPLPAFIVENGVLRLATIVSGGRDMGQVSAVVGADLSRLGTVIRSLDQVGRRGYFTEAEERSETGARFVRP